MAAPTWCPIDADLGKIYLAKETTEGTHTTVGARQMHFLSASHTLGHQPIRRPPHPGQRQKIKLDAEILGPYMPVISLVYPLRYEDAQMLLEAALGGASAAGAWSIGAELPSYSIGINDSVEYWKYSGCKVESASIVCNPGSTVDLQLDFAALLREDSDIATYAALGLTTAPTYAPYTWEEMTIKGDGAATPTTALKPVGSRISWSNNPHKTPEPGNRFPSCQPAGRLDVSGTLNFPFSSHFHSTLQSVIAAYSTFYLAWRWTSTTGAKFLNLELPSSLVVPQRTMPEGSTPMTSDVEFNSHADVFALTVGSIKATSTAY